MSDNWVAHLLPLVYAVGVRLPHSRAEQRFLLNDSALVVSFFVGVGAPAASINIEPGEHISLHSLKGRPSVVIFRQGADTVTNDDNSAKRCVPEIQRQK